jgi:hypothetical protein
MDGAKSVQPLFEKPGYREEQYPTATGDSSRKSAYAWAKSQYRKARWRSTLTSVTYRFLGIEYHLQKFDRTQIGNSLSKWQYIGLRSVPIHEIHGSECGTHEFDRFFRPLAKASREEWLQALVDLVYNKNFQPAEVIKIDDGYIVQNGLYRISAARCLGSSTYLAYVTEWEVEIEGKIDSNPVEIQPNGRYASIENKSSLISNRLQWFFKKDHRKEVVTEQKIPSYVDLFYGLKF